jgi:hypothetical protein
MSYDLTIRPDEKFSRSVPREPLSAFISQLPSITRAARPQFVLEEKPKRWMEISLETVDADGNIIEEEGGTYDTANCIRLQFLTPSSARGQSVTISRPPSPLPTTSAGRCMTSRVARTFRETLSFRRRHRPRSLGGGFGDDDVA